ISLSSRVVQIPGIFLVGFEAPDPLLVAGIAAVPAAIGLWLLLARGSARERRASLVAGSVGVGGILFPLALSLAGLDYLNTKNVIAALLPSGVVLAAGLGAPRAGRAGTAAVAMLVIISVAVDIATAWVPKYHREDWRSAAAALGPARPDRAIVATT